MYEVVFVNNVNGARMYKRYSCYPSALRWIEFWRDNGRRYVLSIEYIELRVGRL